MRVIRHDIWVNHGRIKHLWIIVWLIYVQNMANLWIMDNIYIYNYIYIYVYIYIYIHLGKFNLTTDLPTTELPMPMMVNVR